MVKAKGMKDIWKKGIDQRLIVWEVKKPKQAFYRTIWNYLGVEKKHRFYDQQLSVWYKEYTQSDSVIEDLVTQEILIKDKEYECPNCGNDLVINGDNYICEGCTYHISTEQIDTIWGLIGTPEWYKGKNFNQLEELMNNCEE